VRLAVFLAQGHPQEHAGESSCATLARGTG
jgi:hypothetical protein